MSPLEAETEDILRHLNFQEGKLDRQIVDTFSGVSPLFAKEAVFRAGLANRATLPNVLTEMFSEIKNRRFQPQLITTEDGKEYFYLLELTHIKGDNRPFHTLSELLDRYYFGKAERDRVKQQAHDLERFAANEKKKNENKIKKLKKTLEQSEHAKDFQLYGELLTANLYQLKKETKRRESSTTMMKTAEKSRYRSIRIKRLPKTRKAILQNIKKRKIRWKS